MNHLADDELYAPALQAPAAQEHLAQCSECRVRRQSWRRLAVATRQVATTLAPAVPPPAFESVLAAINEAPTPLVAGPGLFASWRLTAQLVIRQVALMPRSLLPLSLAGQVVAVAIALATDGAALAGHLYAAVVVLVMLLGALATCARRSDPRVELLYALPISPTTVFTARFVLVLSIDVGLALAGSTAVHALGEVAPVLDLVAGWLGQVLLVSAVAVAGTVWRGPGFGGSVALSLWFLGSVTTLPGGALAEKVGAFTSQVWGTTPWAVALAVPLFVFALRQIQKQPEALRPINP